MIEALHKTLDPARIRMGFAVASCAREEGGTVSLTSASGQVVDPNLHSRFLLFCPVCLSKLKESDSAMFSPLCLSAWGSRWRRARARPVNLIRAGTQAPSPSRPPRAKWYPRLANTFSQKGPSRCFCNEFICHNVFINWFEKVNSPTKPLT